jgi:hypothetical protein
VVVSPTTTTLLELAGTCELEDVILLDEEDVVLLDEEAGTLEEDVVLLDEDIAELLEAGTGLSPISGQA